MVLGHIILKILIFCVCKYPAESVGQVHCLGNGQSRRRRAERMQSIWKWESLPLKKEPLTGSHQADVIVIGGGMAGILAGFLLQEAGKKVLVLEASVVGSGQTGGTTAKITAQHGMIYQYLTNKFGSEKSRQYANANQAAIGEFDRIIREQAIACDFRRCPAYLYALTGEQAEDRLGRLEKEIAAAAALGIPAELAQATELPFPIAGAELFPDQATFHPLKFLLALASRLPVCENSKVQKVEGSCVFTNEGRAEAPAIVFACHYPWMVRPGYYFLRMHQSRSYVIGLTTGKKLCGLYRDMEETGLSLRSYGDTLLLGGEGHRTGKNKKGGNYEELARQGRLLYPGCREVSRWSAQDCMTLDRVPYIGALSPSAPGWYVATGFGKWGMTGSMVSAMLLRDQLTGRENPDSGIFTPHRMNWKASVPKLAQHTGSAVVNLSRSLVPFGERKVCRHMGCRLNYNPEEQTWDCPCHGSRYDKAGNLLDGPAQKPLKPGR